MEEQYIQIINQFDNQINVSENDDILTFTKDKWSAEFLLNDYYDYTADEWNEILSLSIKVSEVLPVTEVPYKILIYNLKYISIDHEDWDSEYIVEEDDTEDTVSRVSNFFNLKYIPVKACYRENYLELLINLNSIIWGDGLGHITFYLEDEQLGNEKIHYEISKISDEFAKTIQNNQFYRHIEIDGNFTTLKVYNLNTITDLKLDDEGIEERLMYFAKCILFDLSLKYSLSIKIDDLPEDDEDDEIYEDSHEELNDIKAPFFKKQYDKDLLNYYYRALTMEESEFKYLAFYQILECIFDEVYLHETVQDVKQVINSSWFSSHNDNDITKVIEIVDKYNKNKNDREKLKLVLEKYFKGDVHEHAFLLANKEIIEILKDMKKLSQDKDLNDLQNLSNVLYDFRCECTHSNRTYPFRTEFNKTIGELQNYLLLIKKVTERIIVNY